MGTLSSLVVTLPGVTTTFDEGIPNTGLFDKLKAWGVEYDPDIESSMVLFVQRFGSDKTPFTRRVGDIEAPGKYESLDPVVEDLFLAWLVLFSAEGFRGRDIFDHWLMGSLDGEELKFNERPLRAGKAHAQALELAREHVRARKAKAAEVAREHGRELIKLERFSPEVTQRGFMLLSQRRLGMLETFSCFTSDVKVFRSSGLGLKKALYYGELSVLGGLEAPLNEAEFTPPSNMLDPDTNRLRVHIALPCELEPGRVGSVLETAARLIEDGTPMTTAVEIALALD